MRAPFQILAIPFRRGAEPEFCVLHRSDRDQWQFIAGGGEDEETPAEAAVREIFEESGVAPDSVIELTSMACVPADVISERRRGHWPKDTYVIPEYCFAFECASDIKLSNEHTGCQWLSCGDAMARLTWDSNRTALYELNCRLISEGTVIDRPTAGEPTLELELQDTEWPLEYTDHDREIVRAIVFDGSGYYYFVRAVRDDDFGQATLIETSGGGVEKGEDLTSAVRRELREELGAEVEILCKIGVVSDYYNLIHRHNINNYYLCKLISIGDKNLTQDEIESFHLSTLRLTYTEAVEEYEKRSVTRIGRLIANRELPVLRRAKELIDKIG